MKRVEQTRFEVNREIFGDFVAGLTVLEPEETSEELMIGDVVDMFLEGSITQEEYQDLLLETLEFKEDGW